MSDEKQNIAGDLFGLKPYGEALKISVEKGFDAAQAVLGRICLPAAEELGLMFKDRVRYWRLNNLIRIIKKTEGKIDFRDEKLQLSAHPRVIKEIIDYGSWCDIDVLQEMWAGLIASSYNNKKNDDSNLLFVNTLKNLTCNQVKILNYICNTCKLKVDKNGFVTAKKIKLSFSELSKLLNTSDIHQLDAEFDYLRSIELIVSQSNLFSGSVGGFILNSDGAIAEFEPSSFAINLYVKAQGFKGSPQQYFKLTYSKNK